MEQEDQKIEVQLRERLSQVVPTRASFHTVKEAVTNDAVRRHITEKASVPSPYQSVIALTMNKILLIGVPVAVVAVAAFMFFLNPSPREVGAPQVAVAPVANEPTPGAQPNVPAPVAVVPGANVDTSSIDNITAGFLADADMEASNTLNDNTDQAAINAELTTYDSIKNTSYEVII